MSSEERHLLGQHAEHAGSSARDEESGATIELREEELAARKRAVETGRVSIGTQVVEEHKTLNVPVTHEEVTIQRRAVDHVPSADPISPTSEVLSVPVHAEHVELQKRAVVYEEVGIARQAVQDTQQVSATLRKEVMDVDAEGSVALGGQPDRPR